MTSLDGFFEGPDRDISWHNVDDEFNDYAVDLLNNLDVLLFGKVTYELMASYWPTPAAMTDDPLIAEKMNSLSKIVCSTSLKKVEWENTRLVRQDIAGELATLKEQPGKDLALLGSSDLAVSLAQADLIDEYRVILNPIILGNGKPIFIGLKERLKLKLIKTKTFRSGNVLLCYQPAR